MWRALQSGWIPPEHISEEEYNAVSANREDYPDYYVGYVGFHATFGAKYFGGYARSFKGDGVTPRDQSNEAYRNTMKQLPYLSDVEFICQDYREISTSNSVIYCDPPYENTTGYSTEPLNYDEFWRWCQDMSNDNFVFVSGYDAPDDFASVWERPLTTTLDLNRDSRFKAVEKLFVCSTSCSTQGFE